LPEEAVSVMQEVPERILPAGQDVHVVGLVEQVKHWELQETHLLSILYKPSLHSVHVYSFYYESQYLQETWQFPASQTQVLFGFSLKFG
jgi:hypothetical protein